MAITYVSISSTQNIDIYPQNLWHDFSVELPMELLLKSSCQCAVVEFSVHPHVVIDVNIFCDLIEGSCFEGGIAPFLFKAKESPAFISFPQFHHLIYPSVKNFRIYIRESFTNAIPVQSVQAVNMVLAFKC